MKIEIKDIDLISPYFNNPRNNNNAVKPTVESISRFGFITPIMVDKAGVIICGHTRFFASVQLGFNKIPVIYSDMDEEKAKKFRILDNKVCEKSSFDEKELIAELKAMKAPENMQAFFFEDISSMLNFNSRSIMNNFDYDECPEEVVSESEYNTDITEEKIDEDINLDNDDEKSSEEESDMNLYKPYPKEGKTYMRVLCPYCENIEEVEVR